MCPMQKVRHRMRFIEGEYQVPVTQASIKAESDVFTQSGVGWNDSEG